jgi:hypothetical protein
VFALYAYTGDRIDPPGALIDVNEDELDALPPLQSVLRDRERVGAAGKVPVTLRSSLTDTGALEIHLVTVALPPRRWRLEFGLGALPPAKPSPERRVERPAERTTPGVGKARPVLQRSFAATDPRSAKNVRRELEDLLGPRGEWSAAICRALWEVCMDVEEQRGNGEEHELAWLRICGWCLRPGFGAPLDDARMDRMWTVHERGLRQPTRATWVEWWILWRRIAAGLDAERQRALFEDVRPWLWRDAKPPAGPHVHGPVEMMQLIAVLERLPVEAKTAAGELFLERSDKLGSYWPLGRVGARALLRADASLVVPRDVAERWLKRVLGLDWEKAEGAAFAAASIARLTGAAARDVDAPLRAQVVERLTQLKAPASWIDGVLRASDLAEGDLKRVLGEALPAGLRLTSA